MPKFELEKSVERVPVGSLDERQAAELATVGLSAQFPQVVKRLNDTLIEADGLRSFTGYRFSLTPDPDRPRVSVGEDRYYPFDITVDADILKRAVFSVIGRLGVGVHTINWVELADIHTFAESYPGDYEFRLKATGAGPTIDVPLEELADEAALDEAGLLRGRHEIQIGFQKDEHTGLQLPLIYTGHARDLHSFGVSDIIAKDTAPNIESIVEAYTNLVRIPEVPE